ncbi:hypothetical protein NQ315_006232 [Exocentrus adspersus]|uniref:Alpha-mannosidase n=1 Tax=Exocentrus adspersus TaxID=1586481 RepID=A0AAV8VZE7_9CUCU|nr:hypothetical protein NQ315_006232 [Exocentrus adspersus]
MKMKFVAVAALFVVVVTGKPFDYNADPDDCAGYNACHPVYDDRLNVHLVPHSHDDVGWLSTKDQYYYQSVQYTISTVVKSLLQNPDRRFIQVETAYFYMWWADQSQKTKADVRQLINEGRLEITNGAWSMNDEAAVHYQSTIDQFTLGLRFVEDVLGKCARPRVGWQIDPFGHSREHASLMAQMGMDGLFFARLDYRDRRKRNSDKTADLIWSASENLGNSSSIFTSVLYNHYSAPGGFCFDIRCGDSPIVTDPESTEYNWDTRVKDFANYASSQSNNYPTNNVLITMGDDFQWTSAEQYYTNIDRLIEGFKKFKPTINSKEINIIYSTPSCYAKAVRDAVEAQKIELDVKTDDFFPYADTTNTVWSGYFTSRPTSKRLERLANNLHQVSKQVGAISGRQFDVKNKLSQAMGVMQHHDAITGTEKAAVEKDYHRMLTAGMETATSDISSGLSSLLGLESDLDLKSCLLSNISICAEADADQFHVLVYNPLARPVSHYVQIPVDDFTFQVTGPLGLVIDNQVTDPVRDFSFVSHATRDRVLPKILIFKADNIPAFGYQAYTIDRQSTVSSSSKEKVMAVDEIGFGEDKNVKFDHVGLIRSITINNVTSAKTSGAYIFRPDTLNRDAIPLGEPETTILVNTGNVVREVKQVWNDWVTQIIRIYKDEDYIEFDWAVGPVNITDGFGKEIITRYTTSLKETDGVFYTDSNGREMIYRKKDYRPTYTYTSEEPQAGNYYPVNSKILIRDEQNEFAVLTDRSEGGSSLNSSEVELMLIRALLDDDKRGVGENLNEIEYGAGLVARGSHFVTLGDIAKGNGEVSMAALERDIAQRKLLQPWVFFTETVPPQSEGSLLDHSLPSNVHLLTLEPWSDNAILIRLEHVLEKEEDPNLSKEVTVDVSGLFKTFKIVSMKEYMLAANTPLEESKKFTWSQVGEEDASSPLSKENRLARDEADLNITLAPMQIRTFVATVEFASK